MRTTHLAALCFAISVSLGAEARAQDAGVPDASMDADAGVSTDAGAPVDPVEEDADTEAVPGADAGVTPDTDEDADAQSTQGEDVDDETDEDLPAERAGDETREPTDAERTEAEAAAAEAARLEREEQIRVEDRPAWPPPWCNDDVSPEDDPDPSHDPSICEEPPWDFFGLPRWFVAGRIDLGFLFLRPLFLFGYGTPHETYIALEADPLLSGRGVGVYGGIRAEIPFVELRAGARYFFTFTRSFLAALDTFDHLQIRDRSGPGASYTSLEAQVEFHIPIGPVAIVSETTGTYVIAENNADYPFILEESLRVVLAPPFVWGTSLALSIRFGDNNEYYISPGAELVHLVERDDFVLRVGLRAGIRMWEDLEVRLIAMPAIVSPDSLGAAAGDTFLLGVRYRWASDNPSR